MGARQWSWLAALGLALAAFVAGEPTANADEPPDRVKLLVAEPRIASGAQADAEELRRLLSDTAQDLGYEIDLSAEHPSFREVEIQREARRRERQVLLASVERDGRRLLLRLSLAHPEAKVLHTRLRRSGREDVDVSAAVMLRDLAREPWRPEPADKPRPTPEVITPLTASGPTSGSGRYILVANATVFGGFLGYSIQRASGSDDPRLLYPLMAVGAGVGLGAGFILADEFDLSAGDSWYLASGAWWPGVAGHLVYQGRFGNRVDASDDEAWAFSLVGSVTGVTLATVGLSGASTMDDGGALLAHSGGSLGLIIGGLADIAVAGTVDDAPLAGMGYGAATGWLLGASAAVIFPRIGNGNLLAVDLGMVLGGLAGAAAASPLLIDDVNETKTRGWVAATGAGLIAGGIFAGWLVWDSDEPEPAKEALSLLPSVGQVGVAAAGPGELPMTGWGASLSGQLP